MASWLVMPQPHSTRTSWPGSMYSVCEINPERLLERAEELEQYLEDFPEGCVADAARNELAEIQKAIKLHA